jgi:hypothetical protein
VTRVVLGGLVLALSAWATPAAADGVAKANWQVDTTLSGRAYSIRDATIASGDVAGQAGSGQVGMTYFLEPVSDDGAPRSLQPFLQRASTVVVSLGAGHFVTHNPGAGVDRTDWSAAVSQGADLYLTRMWALSLGFTYAYDVLQDVGVDQATHAFTGSAGVGLRAGDVRLDAGYALTAFRSEGAFAPLRWGSLRLSAFAVMARRLSVSLSGTALTGGVQGSASLAYYPTQDLAIFGGVSLGRADFYRNDLVDRRYAGDVGLSFWVSPDTRLLGEYTLTIDDVPAQIENPTVIPYREVSHAILLEASVRFQ